VSSSETWPIGEQVRKLLALEERCTRQILHISDHILT